MGVANNVLASAGYQSGGSAMDPYAAIRNLQPVMGEDTITEGDSGVSVSPGSWMLDLNALAGTPFQSKYNSLVPLPDGSMLATFQRPGMHKHDTFSVRYRQDPATGQWTMDESTIQAGREKSGARQFWRAVGEGAAVVGAGYLGANALSGAYGLGGGAGGGAGGAAGTGVEGLSGMDLAADAGANALWQTGAPAAGGAAPAVATQPTGGGIAGGGFNDPTSYGNLVTGSTPSGGLPSMAEVAAGSATGYTPVSLAGTGTGGGAAPAAAGAGNYGDLIQGGLGLASSYYGMRQAREAREAMDPFGPYRAEYAAKLKELEANPESVLKLPGFRAGVRTIESNQGAAGFYGSGNMLAALSEFGGDFYQQEANRLADLAGARAQPGAGAFQSAQLTGQALASMGYGIGQLSRFFGGG